MADEYAGNRLRGFAVVLEEAGGNWSAYSPDLPGCVATGATQKEAEANMREAIELHVAGLREEGLEVPHAGHRRCDDGSDG